MNPPAAPTRFAIAAAGTCIRMPRPGQWIHNPITGEHILFHRTSDETEGELVEFDVVLRPGGVISGFPHRHRHPEAFHVTSGRFTGWIAGQGFFTAVPGDRVKVPANTDHIVGNGGLTSARARVEVRPAYHFDRFLETVFALSSGQSPPGRGRLRGMVDAARMARELALMPAIVPKVVGRRLVDDPVPVGQGDPLAHSAASELAGRR
jgi:quercetin dioxygenase-like cupin family protein